MAVVQGLTRSFFVPGGYLDMNSEDGDFYRVIADNELTDNSSSPLWLTSDGSLWFDDLQTPLQS